MLCRFMKKKIIMAVLSLLCMGGVLGCSVSEEKTNNDKVEKLESQIPETDNEKNSMKTEPVEEVITEVPLSEDTEFLKINYVVNESDEAMEKKWYQNENGILKFEFTDVVLQNVYNPFVPENHVHGLGGYAGAVLTLNQNLQPGTETEVFVLSLCEALFQNGSTGTLSVTLSADNYSAKTYEIPLSLK